jgi:hypothetical protein
MSFVICKSFTALALAVAFGTSAIVAPVLAKENAPAADLQAQLLAAETALYRAIFDDCDSDRVSKLVAPELEFFHDKGGQVAKSGAEFVKLISGSCANQRSGKEVKTRREALPGAVVYRMGTYGALVVGRHRFYHLPDGKEPQATEHARFANLWRQEGDQWVLSRVFSFEHVSSAGNKD